MSAVIDADATLKALAEPRRRQILRLLGARDLSAGEVASHFDVTRPAISQHLGVLREAGLISERREGSRRIYSAMPERIDQLGDYLAGFWEEGLDALKQAAEQERKETGRDGSRN
jgi:DNA-binding transcriptional ArsR family regulator